MQNVHKTDFHHVQPCGTCRGKGEVSGAVMTIYCHKCEGVGFFGVDEREDVIAGQIELAHEVRRLVGLVDLLTASTETKRQLYADNTKGPGGACFTGD